MTRPPSQPLAPRVPMPMLKKAGIVLLLDVADHTPQAKSLGEHAAGQFHHHLQKELAARAIPRGFRVIGSTGDGALMFAETSDPSGLLELFLDLFVRQPIADHAGFEARFRLAAHCYQFFQVEVNEQGEWVNLHGAQTNLAFRITEALTACEVVLPSA